MIDAILVGAQEIATPAFVATLSICIVFVPIFLLGGVAYYLFAPIAMAVVFAMLASYFLSRTVVPTMVNFLLKGRDFGSKSEILGGLDPTDRVVQNPTEALHEGMIVSVETAI
jgi:Cu/Ag efflux pump CusA